MKLVSILNWLLCTISVGFELNRELKFLFYSPLIKMMRNHQMRTMGPAQQPWVKNWQCLHTLWNQRVEHHLHHIPISQNQPLMSLWIQQYLQGSTKALCHLYIMPAGLALLGKSAVYELCKWWLNNMIIQ